MAIHAGDPDFDYPGSPFQISEGMGGGPGYGGGPLPPGGSAGPFGLSGRALALATTLPGGYGGVYQRNRLRPFGMTPISGGGGVGGYQPIPGSGGGGVPGSGGGMSPSTGGFRPGVTLPGGGWAPVGGYTPGGGTMPIPGSSGGGGRPGATPGAGPVHPVNPGLINSWDIISELLKGAFSSGMLDPNSPQRMGAIRSRAISDAGANERAARLSLAGRSDVDPSTYGFQSLMSQLKGGSDISQALSRAQLGMQEQDINRLMNLLGQYYSGQVGIFTGQNNSGGGFPWGTVLSGLGTLLGGL